MEDAIIDFRKAKAHEVLSKLGKKVLRPGGKALTKIMMNALEIDSTKKVVEIAPGTGFTANICLQNNPKSYIGIDCNCQTIHHLRGQIHSTTTDLQFIECKADQTPLPNDCADRMYGEAIMTMHANQAKKRFIQEAHRILKQGGWYAIHELALKESVSEEIKIEMNQTLARTMKVNAKPLTVSEWSNLIEEQGFKVIKVRTNRMLLLQFPRILFDEGIQGILRIFTNVLTHRGAAKRVFMMRKTFMKYEKHLQSVMIIAQKK